MSFYVWDTPEVAKFFNVDYSSKYHFYVSINGTRNAVYKDDYRTFIGKSSIEQMKLLGIPEYKLHPDYGLIPANSKLFKEDINKEQEENKMQQHEPKKVFEVGQLVMVKKEDGYEYVKYVKDIVGKKCIIASIFTYGDTEFVVLEHPTLHHVFVTIPMDVCHPILTHKEKTIDKMKEVCNYKGSWSSLYQQFASDLYDAGLRFKDDVQ